MDPLVFGENLFGTLLQGPKGNNVQAYHDAEAQYNQIKTNPEQLLTMILAVLSKSQNTAIKVYAGIMVSKDITAKSAQLYPQLPEPMRNNFNNLIINLI